MNYFSNDSLDDLIFEGRNQQYGAYVLRAQYQHRLLIGSIGGTLLFLFLCFLPLIAGKISNIFKSDKADLETNVFEYYAPIERIETPPPPPPPASPEPVKKATIAFVTPRPEADDKVVQEPIVPEIDDLAGKAISTFTQAGDASDNLNPDDIPQPSPTIIPEETTIVKKDQVYDLIGIQQQPEFPGGEKAMYKWLTDHLRYPRELAGIDMKMTVVTSFVINPEGKITDIKIIRGGNKALEQAVLEALSKMPSWMPGKQNGEAVKCRFTIPVRFELE